MQWYYSKNATQLGPIPDAELRAKLASGEIVGTDMVWREGMPNWLMISTVSELNAAPKLRVDAPTTAGGDSSSQYAPPAAVGSPAQPLPTSGLAIASLICGILGFFCMFLPGIAAVICGHMALTQIANPASGVSGRGIAIVGLVLGYLSLAFLALMVLGMFFVRVTD